MLLGDKTHRKFIKHLNVMYNKHTTIKEKKTTRSNITRESPAFSPIYFIVSVLSLSLFVFPSSDASQPQRALLFNSDDGK